MFFLRTTKSNVLKLLSCGDSCVSKKGEDKWMRESEREKRKPGHL